VDGFGFVVACTSCCNQGDHSYHLENLEKSGNIKVGQGKVRVTEICFILEFEKAQVAAVASL